MDGLGRLFKAQPELEKKYLELLKELSGLKKVAVAFSGGVDSSLLLKISSDHLTDDCIALIGTSPSFPAQELREAEQLAQSIGVQYDVVETSEMESPEYIENSPERCFHCRIHSMDDLLHRATELGYEILIDGANADDASDYRPGRKAGQKLGLRSPLLDAGITKQEVRALAQALGLSVWDKPASACLSSRIPYGTTITLEALERINNAELVLKRMGYNNVRVRHYNDLARIELDPEQFDQAIEQHKEIVEALRKFGYIYVTLDLSGFHSGSMNLSILS